MQVQMHLRFSAVLTIFLLFLCGPTWAQTSVQSSRSIIAGNDVRECDASIAGAMRYAIGADGDSITNGLVGHWRLDETSGTFADSSVNNNVGTQSGGVTYAQPGVIGNAVGFNDDLDQRIQVPHHASLTPTEDMTVSFWVNPNEDWGNLGGSVWRLIDKRASANNSDPGWVINANGWFGGVIILAFSNGVEAQYGYSSYDDWTTGSWYHVVIVYEQNGTSPSITFYRNGEFSNTDTVTGPFTPNWGSSGLRIGGGYWDDGLNGLMDDVRIYNRALTAEDVAALYAGSIQVCKPAGGNSCPNIGDVCVDGSVYAGISPDGGIPMYTTATDSGGMPWNNGNTTGIVNLYTPITESYIGGAASTAAFIGVDSDSITAGVQPFQAPEHCHNSQAHGQSDWYVPARDEFFVLRNNRVAIGGWTGTNYWSASEVCCDAMFYYDLTGGGGSGVKRFGNSVRCVRKSATPPAAYSWTNWGQ